MKRRWFVHALAPIVVVAFPTMARADDPPANDGNTSAPAASPPATATAGTSTSTAAPEGGEGEGSARDGLRFGARTGYMIPVGEATKGSEMSDGLSGGVPLWFDIGYRFAHSHVYVGGFFQYAFVFPNDDGCDRPGVSCSASQVRIGAMFAYHFIPEGSFDPWIGAGLGYEILNISQSSGTRSVDGALKGIEFLHFQVGGDYIATPNVRIGPFLGAAVGQYSTVSVGSQSADIDETAIHAWFTFGIRGAYDLHL